MKLSRGSAYAVYGLQYLAGRGLHQRVTIAEIANSVSLPEKHLAKIFMHLAKTRMVHSVRGIHGGFMLARPSEQISLLEIVEATEGPFDMDSCFYHFGTCDHPDGCQLCDFLRSSQRAVMNVLQAVTISDFVKGEGPELHWQDSQDAADANLKRQKECATA